MSFVSGVSVLGMAALLTLAQAAVALGQDPPPAAGDLRFTAITAGGSHSCGLTSEGAAYCWGKNEFGQLGDSSHTDRSAPVRVAGGLAFRLLSAGAQHTCGADTDGVPYCWGSNVQGQLGLGSTSDRNSPVRVATNIRVTGLSAGGEHTCATIVHWERQDRMMCWGSNAHGQLGVRGEVRDAWSPILTFGTIKYAAIAAGSQHTCAASKQELLFCWGSNGRGELGNGSRTPSPVPFLIRLSRRQTFVSVSTGAAHSCALTSDGQVYCWGDNAAGQVGNGGGKSVIIPARLRDTLKFTALSAGGDATCGLRPDGSVSCWGSNAAGQFGGGAPTGSETPIAVLPRRVFTAISLGKEHACGLQADGSAYCWGAGRPEPVRVVAQPD